MLTERGKIGVRHLQRQRASTTVYFKNLIESTERGQIGVLHVRTHMTTILRRPQQNKNTKFCIPVVVYFTRIV